MIDINSAAYIKTRKASIDGHIYTVRQASAKMQLSIMQMQRRVKQLEGVKEPTAKQEDQLTDMLSRLYGMYEPLFDDGVSGEKTKVLLAKFDWQGLSDLMAAIWKEKDEAADATDKPSE